MSDVPIKVPCPSVRYFKIDIRASIDGLNAGEVRARACDEFNARTRQMFALIKDLPLFTCRPAEGEPPERCVLIVRSDAPNHENLVAQLPDVQVTDVPNTFPQRFHAVCEGTEVFAVACTKLVERQLDADIRTLDAQLANKTYQDFAGTPMLVRAHWELECPSTSVTAPAQVLVIGYSCYTKGTNDAADAAAALAQWWTGFREKIRRTEKLLALFFRCKTTGPGCQGKCDAIPAVKGDLSTITSPKPQWDPPNGWHTIGAPPVTFTIECPCRRWF